MKSDKKERSLTALPNIILKQMAGRNLNTNTKMQFFEKGQPQGPTVNITKKMNKQSKIVVSSP